MATEVVVTDEFVAWYEGLSQAEQDRVAFTIGLLEERGVTFGLWKDFRHRSC